MVLPGKRDAGRVDRDTPFLLFGIRIGLGCAFVDFTDAMLGSRVVEHPFRHCRLTGIYMGNDADISDVFQSASHEVSYLRSYSRGP